MEPKNQGCPSCGDTDDKNTQLQENDESPAVHPIFSENAAKIIIISNDNRRLLVDQQILSDFRQVLLSLCVPFLSVPFLESWLQMTCTD
jgi:hypothetical protein